MNIQLIKDKFDDLKYRDISYKRFGSGKHLYRSYKVSEEEVNNFETKWEIALPSDYKQFLLEIGYGTGPYYGISNLNETNDELEDLISELKEENINVHPSLPFPLSEKDIEKINRKMPTKIDENTYFPYPIEYLPCSGTIPICHHGCTFWSYLIVTGELKGTVWDVACFAGYEGDWTPAGFDAKNNKFFSVTFEEWIENWTIEEPVYTSNSYSTFTNNIIEFVTDIFK